MFVSRDELAANVAAHADADRRHTDRNACYEFHQNHAIIIVCHWIYRGKVSFFYSFSSEI
jgi:hypothetical protein